MPDNKEMVSKVLHNLGVSPVETILTIPGYNTKKPYKLHIKEVKDIVKPSITIRKAEPKEMEVG